MTEACGADFFLHLLDAAQLEGGLAARFRGS